MTTITDSSALAAIAKPEIPAEVSPSSESRSLVRKVLNGRPAQLAAAMLILAGLLALLAPWLGTVDPSTLNPSHRLQAPSALHWLGTDSFGRDIYSRLLYGSRASLTIGIGVVAIAVSVGLAIGVLAGYFRWFDAVAMRVMDGLMAIPGVLLAIALVALSGATITTVLFAIAIPEVPRVVRLVRSVVLAVRNEAYVEAAASLGTRLGPMIVRHILPSTLAPLLVLGTYIFASAILTEAVLSFLGAGLPPATATWGNSMADGRSYFMLRPGIVLFPGVLISLSVLSVNILGDALRDGLDPRMAKRL